MATGVADRATVDRRRSRGIDADADAAEHFGANYATLKNEEVRIVFQEGWGLLRASNTQPVLVLRFEATSEPALVRYRSEVEDWLRTQGVYPGGS